MRKYAPQNLSQNPLWQRAPLLAVVNALSVALRPYALRAPQRWWVYWQNEAR